MAKRTGDKYDAIIDAAVRVIAEHGYHNAQVAKIAREAKVADGTIYLYFENKDDVLISLFTEKMGKFVSEAKQVLKQIDSPIEQLREIIRLHFEILEQDYKLAIVTQIELRQANPKIRKRINAVLKKYLDVIDRVIEEGIKQGMFRPDVDVRNVRKMIFGTIDETVSSWIMDNRKYSLVEQADEIHRLFLYGIKQE